MAVTLTTCTNSNIGNGIEVGSQHLFVAKQFVTERVQTIQRDSDISRCDPLLEFNAVLEIVGTWASFERWEGDVSELQWRNVTVFTRAEGSRFIFALLKGERVGQAVGAAASGTVELIRNPRAFLADSLVDRERFRARRVEHNSNVSYVKRFSCKMRDSR